ncbi:hypothetical protein ACQ4PT_060002 [Festuca glaucescens]
MRQVSPAAMESGSGIDHFQEPVHGQREDSNAATPPSDGAPSAVAAEGGGADAASPSPLPAAPVDRPQESAREQAGGGGRGTHGSGSAALGANLKAKGPGDIPPGPSSAGSNLSIPSPDSAGPSGAGTPSSEALDSKELFEVFEQLVREAGAEKKKKKKPDEEQAKSSCPKKGLWSKLKNLFTRKKKIVDREARLIYLEHVGHQTLPITEVGNRYRATEDMPICVDLDAYSRIRPVLGDGECFYRSFIFSYLEQVLDREDTHEEHRLLDTIERLSTEHTNLGWDSEFCRSHEAFKELINKVMEWKGQGNTASHNRFLIRLVFCNFIIVSWPSAFHLTHIISSFCSYRKAKLLKFFSTYDTTNDIFVFLRLVVAVQICSHSGQYGDLIPGLGEDYNLKDWCFQNVTLPREFTDHVMMMALATALEVPLRLERLYGGGSAEDNIYTGPGVVRVTLLYTGNHYDIIYPRAPPAESSSRQDSQRESPAG